MKRTFHTNQMKLWLVMVICCISTQMLNAQDYPPEPGPNTFFKGKTYDYISFLTTTFERLPQRLPPFLWSYNNLPPGMSVTPFNQQYGSVDVEFKIHGTPTETGIFNSEIILKDRTSQRTFSITFTVTVSDHLILYEGRYYENLEILNITNTGVNPYATVQSFNTPPGMLSEAIINPSSIVVKLNGTPSQTGAYEIKIITGNSVSENEHVINVTVNEALVNNAALSDDNYIAAYSPIEKVKTRTEFNNLPLKNAGMSVQYFDGLGRLKQEIGVKQSPAKKDIVIPVVYDEYGREHKKYLPFANSSQNGRSVSSPIVAQAGYYKSLYGSVDGNAAYSETVFENSPLNRVQQQGAPGEAWQPGAHPVRFEYNANQASDVCLFKIENNQLVYSGYYNQNALHKTVTKDENWSSGKKNTTEEFKDKEGKVILKRSYPEQDVTKCLNTYYVYDDFGLLRCVLPPQAFDDGNNSISEEELNNYCYLYNYDARKRLIYKKLPGADWVYMVYDKRDRLVAQQDGNQRSNSRWIITKYDVLNRPVMTGYYTSSKNQTQLQAEVDSYSHMYESRGGSFKSYTNQAFPQNLSEANLFTVSYYDDYNISNCPQTSCISVSGYATADVISKPTGQLTATLTRVLNRASHGREWVWAVQFYDKNYRVVQSYTHNYLNGYDRVTNEYDFTGNITKSFHEHKVQNYNITYEETRNTYDHAGRLLSVSKEYSGALVASQRVIARHIYDDLGRLKTKQLENAERDLDYDYNIRNWITLMNAHKTGVTAGKEADEFGYEMYYETGATGFGGISQYNGNIGAIEWWSNNISGASNHRQAYGYQYDGINRLLLADFREYISGWQNPANTFDVGNLSYDLNGNIQSIRRYGRSTQIDNMTYSYSGNQLKYVNDSSDDTRGFKEVSNTTSEYAYDGNGNMITDSNKEIASITYNYLNLPETIVKSGQTSNYAYDAVGVKHENRLPSGKNLQYCANFVYENGVLKYVLNEEGKLEETGYKYFIKDHLGNVRMTVGEGSSSVPSELNHYYPFGMRMAMSETKPDTDQKYRYNGKELQEETEWLDYGARMYDAAIARFSGCDPLADEFYELSPYNYASNSPIANIDLWGLQAFCIHGTLSNPSTFDYLNDDDIKQLTKNRTVYKGFIWPDGTNGYTNDQEDRAIAASALAKFVLENSNHTQEENITLLAHSHGGNVAIQAIDLIRNGLEKNDKSKHINLITIATPAYNGQNDPENPINTSVDYHTHYFSKYDAVQTTLANLVGSKTASQTYTNFKTINIKVNDEKTVQVLDVHNPGLIREIVVPKYDPIESHSIHHKIKMLLNIN